MASQGYLLDFSDFKRTLSGIIQDPDAYQDIAVSYLKFGWQVRLDTISSPPTSLSETQKITVAIGAVRQASLEKAYEHFRNNPSLHEEIYHHAMSIWR